MAVNLKTFKTLSADNCTTHRFSATRGPGLKVKSNGSDAANLTMTTNEWLEKVVYRLNLPVDITVKHGNDSNKARPLTAGVVTWQGTAEPKNARTNDIWSNV